MATKRSHVPNKTFQINGLTISLHPKVYDPAEDTFLLLESIQVFPGQKLLEIGTGCGIIALDCARRGAHVVCTDINPFAVLLTQENIQQNEGLLKGPIEVREGDLFSPLFYEDRFNTIIFNPPYLPTKPKEKVNHYFDQATDGGNDGLQVTKRFIRTIKPYLHKKGNAYFVFSSLSSRTVLEHCILQESFSFSIIRQQRFNDETLDVYRISPTD